MSDFTPTSGAAGPEALFYFGSLADISLSVANIRFTPESGHGSAGLFTLISSLAWTTPNT
jgi:hypothetical protein